MVILYIVALTFIAGAFINAVSANIKRSKRYIN